MDSLRTLRVFVCVAEHASFAQAARRLGMAPATVSRTVASLESRVGVQLLRRTTRSVRLTDEGAVFLERCRAGMAEIDAGFDALRGRRGAPSGTLTVTAPVMFGRRHVQPLVHRLLQQHPDLQIRMLLLDRVVNLVDEGVDVAVRIAQLPDSSLHLLRVGEVRRLFVASPAYLADRGCPVSSADLRHHDVISIDDEVGPQRVAGLAGAERHGRSPRLAVNNMEAAVAAAVAGLGIVRALSYQVAEELADGRLQHILKEAPGQALPVSLLFQTGRRHHPNVRVFVEAAREHLATAI